MFLWTARHAPSTRLALVHIPLGSDSPDGGAAVRGA